MSGQRIFELLKDGANERDIINEIDIFVSEGGDINVIGGGEGVVLASANTAGRTVSTILELAIVRNYKSVVKHLLNFEYLEIDKSLDASGLLPTPLWLAVALAGANRDEDISIDLINKGANTNIKSISGMTLLKFSEIYNLHRVVVLLNPIPCPHNFRRCSKISEGGDGYCYNEINVGRYVNRLNPLKSCNKDYEEPELPESEITGDSNYQKTSNSNIKTPLLESYRGGGKNKSNSNKLNKTKHKRKNKSNSNKLNKTKHKRKNKSNSNKLNKTKHKRKTKRNKK